MKDYTYTLKRKYPFIKKRPLTRIELIRKRCDEMINIYPIVITIYILILIIGFFKGLFRKPVVR